MLGIATVMRLAAIALLLLPTAALADVFAEIRERGTVRIGVAPFVPWTFATETDGLDGFEIAVGEQIAEDMGVTAEFKLYPFEDIIAALQAGEIDVIAAGLAITPERALDVAFTIPYFSSGVALATNTDMTAQVGSLPEIDTEGIIVATVAETLAFDFTERFFQHAEVRVFDLAEDAALAVVEGDAHAYVASLPEARFLALANPTTIDLPLAEPLLASEAGLAVRQGEQNWLNFLNAWITAREADRWLASTHSYWFGSLDWAERVAEP